MGYLHRYPLLLLSLRRGALKLKHTSCLGIPMDEIAQTFANDFAVQAALKVIGLTLQLTAYLFPSNTVVKVIGGGSAGCVVARRLSEVENFNVLLIEAGDDPPMEVMLPGLLGFTPHSRLDWNYTSQNDEYTMQCHKGGVVQMTRGLVLGGCSSVNYMYYERGCPHDYQRWAEIARDQTWNWTNVFPYFLKSERLEDPAILDSPYRVYHGTRGPIGVTREPNIMTMKYLDAIKELGIDVLLDINGKTCLGYTNPLYTIAQGVRQSTGYSYLSPIKNRKNLHILKLSLVTKIIFNKYKRATAVEILTENKKKIVINARKEIILSAGALNSPKILMLSGVGPEDQMKPLNIETVVNLPVGYNMQDHIFVMVMHQMKKAMGPIKPRSPHLFPVPTVIGFAALNKSQTFADYEVTALFSQHDSAENILTLFSKNMAFIDEINQKLYDGTRGRNTIISGITPLHPVSRGQVMLRSADPKDPPLIFTGVFDEDSDLERLLDYIEDYLKIDNTTYFRSVDANLIDLAGNRCNRFVKGSRQYWRCQALCSCSTMYHVSGTCAMGSVVDSELRVLGVQGLRVVDASVMPLLPGANTNIPTIMIAEKASDMIKKDYQQHCP